MRKILFIYNRPDFLDISKYPFFHKLVEILCPFFELSLIDSSNSNLEELFYGVRKHYKCKNIYFTTKLLRRIYKKLFVFFCIYKIFKYRHDYIILIGASTIDLIPSIKKYRKVNLIYLDDEFPWLFRDDLILISKNLTKANLIISLDPLRKLKLFEKLEISNINSLCIPNIPSNKQLNIKETNWIQKLNLNDEKRYILFHGNLGHFCQLQEVLSTIPLWEEEYSLIIIGWRKKYYDIYRHLLNDRVVIYEGFLDDDEYNSLIAFSYATLCLYTKYKDLEYVGMSSGKLLRCIILGTPVITNNYKSLDYVTEMNAGLQIKNVLEISDALKKLNFHSFENKVKENFHFEANYFKLLNNLKKNIDINL